MVWVFGDGISKEPIIKDSRKITSVLAKILTNNEATDYLEKNGNLEDAYELSDGEKDMFFRQLRTSKNSLQKALGLAYKYKSDETKGILDELSIIVGQLKKMVK